MIEISEEMKNLFKSDSIKKYLRIYIDGAGYISNEYIYYESFRLRESIVDGNWEFKGCFASEMSVKIQSHNNFTKSNWKDHLIKAEMSVEIPKQIDDDGNIIEEAHPSEYIPLFQGYIDKCEKDSDRQWQTLTCYDALSSKFTSTYLNGEYSSVYSWYSKFFSKKNTPKVLYAFRESLFEELAKRSDLPNLSAILPSAGYLPNDFLPIKKHFKYKDMTVMDILQGLCQINGCFGRMTRTGEFQFVYISNDSTLNGYGAYPSACMPNQVSPSQPYDYHTNVGVEYMGEYYREITHQDNVINPLSSGITIRNNADDSGVTVTDTSYRTVDWDSSGVDGKLISDDDEVTSGKYIIEGNMFAYKQSKTNLQKAISNIIYTSGSNTNFRQFTAKSNGIPYLECGDKVIYKKTDGTNIEFVVTNRTINGIQALVDTYDSSIDPDKTEYISTPQKCVSNTSSSLSVDEATDITTENINDTLSTGEYMYVVSWDASTGILETSSGIR